MNGEATLPSLPTGSQGSPGGWTAYVCRIRDKASNISATIDDIAMPVGNKYTRVASADPLKKMVFDSIKDKTAMDIHQLESKKDEKLFHGKSYRDLLIEVAMKKRDEDELYWVKAALNEVKGTENIIVTDWRFPNEAEYVKKRFPVFTTIRLVRNIPIPPKNEVTEHSLDGVATDIILFSGMTWDKVCEMFPQYAQGYEPCPIKERPLPPTGQF